MKAKAKIFFLCALAMVAISAGGVGHVTYGTHRYWADGTGPTPPPIPMKAPSEPTYLADGTGPTPPPIPMKALAGSSS